MNVDVELREADRGILVQALAQAAEAILILGKDLRISYANGAFCRQTDFAAQDLIGHQVTSLGPPPFPGMPSDPLAFEMWIRERGQATGEVQVPTKSGVAIPAYMSIYPVFDARKAILGYVETHLDLRPIKQAEWQLHESEEQFRAISSAAQDAVIMLDDAGRIIFWNESARRLLGYTAEEAVGQNAHMLLAPVRYHNAHAAAWPRFAKEGRGPVIGQVLELEARRKDGTEFPIELSVSAVQLKGHWHAVGIMRDITARKNSERELKLFYELLSNSNDAIEVLDRDTLRFLDVNEKECRDLGYSREELLSMTIRDIDPDFGPDLMRMVDAQVAKSGAAVFERFHRRKDGSSFPVEISLKFIEISKKTYILSIARDITERKEAERKLQRSNRALQMLSTGNTTLVYATEEQQLLSDMCQTIVQKGGYPQAWIELAEQHDNQGLRQVASAVHETGIAASRPKGWADIAWKESAGNLALRLRTPQLAKDILTNPEFGPWREHALACGYASCLALPLKKTDGDLLGLLNVCAVEADGFDHGLSVLREMADDLAFGITTLRTRAQRDQLQRENLRNLGRLKDALLGTVRAVARMSEERDPYTAGHQSRVADLSSAIARELGLDDDRIEGLRLAATIHDIGKISIPAEILNRPGKLSPPEFEIVKNHARAGHEIIKDLDFPWPVASMVLQHHERLDGSGYPQGLKGNAICLEARILAVADIVDATCAHRPYRPALGIGEALAAIEAGRGKTLDAEVVGACVRLVREKGYSLGSQQPGNGTG